MSITEIPRYLPVGDDVLFGILGRPTGPSNGAAVVVLHGGGEHNLPSHRNRWTVDFARSLSADGFTVFRVAYRGVGESTGGGQAFNLSNPFVSDGLAIVEAVLSEPEVEQVYLVGSCFGARTALGLVPEIEQISGVVLASLPVADHERRAAHDAGMSELMRRGFGKRGLGGLFVAGRRGRYVRIIKNKVRTSVRVARSDANPTPWVADTVVQGLAALTERGGSALLVYGTDDEFYTHFREAAPGPLGKLAEAESIEVDAEIQGRLHGYPSVAVQDAFARRAGAWLRGSVRR